MGMLLLIFAGSSALCLSQVKSFRICFPAIKMTPIIKISLRLIGCGLLALALVIMIGSKDVGIELTRYVGMLNLAAILVISLLTWRRLRHSRND
jgi:hypothetical protein